MVYALVLPNYNRNIMIPLVVSSFRNRVHVAMNYLQISGTTSSVESGSNENC